jgi:hypothetical protein
MADARSNYPEVRDAIRAVAQSWDFRGRGRYRTLGEDALDVVAQGIYDRTFLAQQLPDGRPLPPLAPATLRDKRRHGFPDTVLVRTGAMGDYRQLQGQRAIERRTASATYGTDEELKQRAEFAAEGSKKQNRPPRPFYELDGTIEAQLDALFEEVLETNLRDLGG